MHESAQKLVDTTIPGVGKIGDKLFDLLNHGAAYAMGRGHILL